MKADLDRYRQAGLKGVEFQLRFLQPDGAYIWEDFAHDAHHKQAYSWLMAGKFGPAHRLLNWVARERLQENGELEEYNGDCYKHSWFFQGAHKLGRFELSYPVLDFLGRSQDGAGGLGMFAADKYSRSLATAWAGISALYAGRIEMAEKSSENVLSMLEQQPDESRFYFQMTREGTLVTPEVDESAQFIDTGKPGQAYWEAGLPMMLMCRMYQVTRQQEYLDHAEKFFQFKLRCYKDNYSNVGSGKSSLAAALYYLLADDERGRDAAITFLEFLMETQYPEGGWRDPGEPDIPLIYIDHAAEYNVWIQEVCAVLESKA